MIPLGPADDSDDDGDVDHDDIGHDDDDDEDVPKERCRCSRVNKLSCSDIHESSGEHLSRPFSLEMTMMVMVMN